MNNLFAQSRSHWVRYDRYEIKIGKDGKRYITPEKTAKPDVYNPLKESSEMVLEALNVGMLMMNRNPEDVVEEMKLFLQNVDSEGTVFRSNHASNYVILKGTLNEDIPSMLAYLRRVEEQGKYREERWRRF